VVTAISLDPGVLAWFAGVAHKSRTDNLAAMGLLHPRGSVCSRMPYGITTGAP